MSLPFFTIRRLTTLVALLISVGFFLLTASAGRAQSLTASSTGINQVAIVGYTGTYAALAIPDTLGGSAVTSIAADAFKACGSLTTVSIGNNVTSIGANAFSGSSLTSVTFGSKVATIGPNAFAGTGLTTVVLPASVTSIGDYAFSGCNYLTTLTLGDHVATIGISAFEYCGLTSVIFPASVATIENSAFYPCNSLKYVIFLGNAPNFTPFGSIFFPDISTWFGYYFNGATGFSANNAINVGPYSPVTVWLINKGLAYDANVQSAPNGDGVPLLLAYALNLNPKLNQSALLPKPVVSGSQLSLTFYAGNPGINYSVEASPDLKTWNAITLSGTDAYGQITASLALSGTNRFMRLKVLKNP